MLITSIHCLYTGNTCTYNVNTCQIQGMYMFYNLHTVCKHHIHIIYRPLVRLSQSGTHIYNASYHIYNASCSKSSFLYIDCLDLSRPYSYLSELAIRNYLESGQSMSGSVHVVRILWLSTFSGKYMYIQCIDTYIHVFTRKSEKS